MHNDFVIASTYPPLLFDNYPSADVATVSLHLAAAYNAERRKRGQELLRFDVMRWADWEEAEKAYYVSQPLTEIAPEQFHEAFDMLPPINVDTDGVIERFCMSEPQARHIFRQFALINGRAFTRLCDIIDPSTFITAAEIRRTLRAGRAGTCSPRRRAAALSGRGGGSAMRTRERWLIAPTA